jgi:hypothetical protein
MKLRIAVALPPPSPIFHVYCLRFLGCELFACAHDALQRDNSNNITFFAVMSASISPFPSPHFPFHSQHRHDRHTYSRHRHPDILTVLALPAPPHLRSPSPSLSLTLSSASILTSPSSRPLPPLSSPPCCAACKQSVQLPLGMAVVLQRVKPRACRLRSSDSCLKRNAWQAAKPASGPWTTRLLVTRRTPLPAQPPAGVCAEVSAVRCMVVTALCQVSRAVCIYDASLTGATSVQLAPTHSSPNAATLSRPSVLLQHGLWS